MYNVNSNSNHCLPSELPSVSTRVRLTLAAASAHPLENFKVQTCSSSSSSGSRRSSGSSSSSSHDRPIGPLPVKCWPEAFHATFIHNIRERGKTEWMEEKLRSVPPQLPTTTTSHPTLTDEKVAGGK